MNEIKPHPLLSGFAEKANINNEQYQKLYQQSCENPAEFWGEQATRFITWFKPWTNVIGGNFDTLDIKWFTNSTLNACYNCVDRHLDHHQNKIALIWEGNSPHETQSLTYKALHKRICQFANVLKTQGIKKGDRVCIYLPMIPEAVIAMLACARIGAIHSVVFGGFSADALKTRLLDSNCALLITADVGLRGDKTIPLKKNCDIALEDCPDVKTVIVVKRTGHSVNWVTHRDYWYHDMMNNAHDECPIEHMDANDPLFILYTSGSTGKPKGVTHSTGGYLLFTAITHYYVFDYHEGDVHWCTADLGWITGHSYLVYGPLANGATTLLFEGVPHYPNYSRYWNVIDKHQVTVFYTAPTALRALRQEGDAWVSQASRKSLRLLGSVGEPINPDVWEWYYQIVGENRCPIVNTWWQTETGGILLSPLPGATPLTPGSAGVPFFGVVPEIVSGRLVIKQPWPGLMQTIYGDRARFVSTYLQPIPGYYLTGDGAHFDEMGHFWITGRCDDIIKVSGHRLGTEELESALISHKAVSEAAVVGIPHDIKGEGIFAFVTINSSYIPTDPLKKELIHHVRNKIGPLATLEDIQWTSALPKTRSGKIMRRILKHIASNQFDHLGDTSTLTDADVVEQLIAERMKQ